MAKKTSNRKEYALLFRMDITNKEAQPTEKQMEEYMRHWMKWINDIADKGQMLDGNHFSREGRVLMPGNKSNNKPYISDSISVAGYIIVSAKDLDDAAKIAEKCPILEGENTSVEIRELASPGT